MQSLTVKKEHSIFQTCEPDEVWEISVGKQVFIINGKHVNALKSATSSGERGLVWFDGFAVSIAHITSLQRKENSKSVIEKKTKEYAQKFGMLKNL